MWKVKANPIVFVIILATVTACQTASTKKDSSQIAQNGILSKPQLAELRLQEAETTTKLLADGELRYREDEDKVSGFQYCSISLKQARRGEFRQAVRTASKALFLGEESGNNWLLAHAHRDLGYAYSLAGFLKKAEEHSDEAIYYAEEWVSRTSKYDRAKIILGPAYKVLGDISVRRDDPESAIGHYKKALSDSRENLKPALNVSIGNAYLAMSNSEKSKHYFNIGIKSGGLRTSLMAMRGMGNAFIAEGDKNEGEKWFNKAIDHSVNSDDQLYHKMWANRELGKLEFSRNKVSSALKHYNNSIKSAEVILARFRSEQFKSGFFSNTQDIYDETIDVLFSKSDAESAFSISDKSRSRALLDLVGRRDYVSRDHFVFSEMKNKSATISEFQRKIPNDTSVVVYHLTEFGAYAWVIGKQKWHSVKLKGNREHYEKLSRKFRGSLSRISLDSQSIGASLYEALIEPLNLTFRKNTVIIPHSELHYIPFQSLVGPEGYLIEKTAISYSISASVMLAMIPEAKRDSSSLLAFGNPTLGSEFQPLPAAEEEVKLISNYFKNSSVYKNQNATKDKLLNQGPNHNVIHVATHSELDRLDPLYSTIYFSPTTGYDSSGYLEAHELYRMKLPKTALFTLSACETGLGTVTKGDEVWGFVRTIFSTGASSFLMSLWEVEDEATKLLMDDFYRNRKGNTSAEALQKTQLKFISNGKYRHPFFWAPFVLMGNP